MPKKTPPRSNHVRALRAALVTAADALDTAVERYDMLGWYDESDFSSADEDDLAEAQGVEAALKKVKAALKLKAS